MKTTPKVVSIDTELKWRARIASQNGQKEAVFNNNEVLELYSKIGQLDIDYKAKKKEVHSANNKEDVTICDNMEIIFEERTIERAQMVCESVEIEQALGGDTLGDEGFNYWTIVCHRMFGVAAALVVKIYARKQDRTGNLSRRPEN
ncbi:hypothetical protein CPC16_001724 [Podila verticillata]|nr:hypothetical protein CPC16_001724 [Podila verticillata]